MHDELESRNDTACLRYMFNNNSNNNTIRVAGACDKYTCVCVCVCMHGRHSHVCPLSFLSFHTNRAGSHMRRCPQACIKTPSTILHTNPAPCQRFALLCQPPAQPAQAVQLHFKMASCQQKRRAYGSFQISLIQTLWLQMGGLRTPNPPPTPAPNPPPSLL